MSSLSPKDRASLCTFTFADGRRCRMPRFNKQSRFCPDHAEKEAKARAAESLGKDLDYFFSGNYLSACDLSAAMGRLIPAVIRGDIKPKVARTVAYMAQTLLQTIHLSKHEYINAFGTDDWRKSIRNSVNGNYNYNHRFPFTPSEAEGPVTTPAQPKPTPSPAPHVPNSPIGHPERSEGPQPISATQQSPVAHPACPKKPASSSNSSLAYPEPQGATPHSLGPNEPEGFTPSEAAGPLPQTSPHTPLPPTSAEFAQHLLAGRNSPRLGRETGGSQSREPAPPSTEPQPAAVTQLALSNVEGTTRTQRSEPSRDTPWWNFGRAIPPDSHLL